MSETSHNKRLKLDEKKKKKVAKKKGNRSKVKDRRVFNIPPGKITELVTDIAITNINGDLFKLSFFEMRTTVGDHKDSNQTDCVCILAVSRNSLKRLSSVLVEALEGEN